MSNLPFGLKCASGGFSTPILCDDMSLLVPAPQCVTVPTDFATIQAAVNSVTTPTLIHVCGGTYAGFTIDSPAASITVRGAGDSTIVMGPVTVSGTISTSFTRVNLEDMFIVGEGASPALTLAGTSTSPFFLNTYTVSNVKMITAPAALAPPGSTALSTLAMSNTSLVPVTLDNCSIRNFNGTETVTITGDGSSDFISCLIENSDAAGSAGTIISLTGTGAGVPTIFRNTTMNGATAGGAFAIAIDAKSVNIFNCKIQNISSSVLRGNGMFLLNGANATVSACQIFVSATVSGGAGTEWWASGDGTANVYTYGANAFQNALGLFGTSRVSSAGIPAQNLMIAEVII